MRRTPLLSWCFSFRRLRSFSKSRIWHGSALDIRFARFVRLRTRLLSRPSRSACASRSHFFQCQSRRGGLFLARLGFLWRWCRRLWSRLFSRSRCFCSALGFLFASNNHFLCVYFCDQNQTAK